MLKRCLRSDLAACGLLLVGLLVAISIFGHDPADPPVSTVHPPNSVASNPLGPAGAWLAATLLEALGLAVYVLLPSWLVLVVLLIRRRGLLTRSLRAAGWLLLIPCAAVCADYLAPVSRVGPVSGGGGTVGAWLRVWNPLFIPAHVSPSWAAACAWASFWR
jgi:hypothetical protein